MIFGYRINIEIVSDYAKQKESQKNDVKRRQSETTNNNKPISCNINNNENKADSGTNISGNKRNREYKERNDKEPQNVIKKRKLNDGRTHEIKIHDDHKSDAINKTDPTNSNSESNNNNESKDVHNEHKVSMPKEIDLSNDISSDDDDDLSIIIKDNDKNSDSDDDDIMRMNDEPNNSHKNNNNISKRNISMRRLSEVDYVDGIQKTRDNEYISNQKMIRDKLRAQTRQKTIFVDINEDQIDYLHIISYVSKEIVEQLKKGQYNTLGSHDNFYTISPDYLSKLIHDEVIKGRDLLIHAQNRPNIINHAKNILRELVFIFVTTRMRDIVLNSSVEYIHGIFLYINIYQYII